MPKIEPFYKPQVYPMIKVFEARQPDEFEHTDNRYGYRKVNLVKGWEEKRVIIPPLPKEGKGLELAQPRDPAFVAYISLVSDQFQRKVRRQAQDADEARREDFRDRQWEKLEGMARKKAIEDGMELVKLRMDGIAEEFRDQVTFNVDKRYEVRDEWTQNQRDNVQHRIEEQGETYRYRQWLYWHMRDYREWTERVEDHKKEVSLVNQRFENLVEESHERMEQPLYKREMMAFYNPTELAIIFAAHQMAQNYMQGYIHHHAIDLPKFATGEAGIRTMAITNSVWSY